MDIDERWLETDEDFSYFTEFDDESINDEKFRIEVERPIDRLHEAITGVIKGHKDQVIEVYTELYKKSFRFDYSTGKGRFMGIDQPYRDACHLYLFFQFNSLMNGKYRMLMTDRYMKRGMGLGMDRINKALDVLKREESIKVRIIDRKTHTAKRYVTLI